MVIVYLISPLFLDVIIMEMACLAKMAGGLSFFSYSAVGAAMVTEASVEKALAVVDAVISPVLLRLM
jgi:hypothetical protein